MLHFVLFTSFAAGTIRYLYLCGAREGYKLYSVIPNPDIYVRAHLAIIELTIKVCVYPYIHL